MLMAAPTRIGMVMTDSRVVTETSPTDTSTSLPYFAANIESIAAVGAEAEAVRAMAMVGSKPKPRTAIKVARTINGMTKSLNADATSAGAQRK